MKIETQLTPGAQNKTSSSSFRPLRIFSIPTLLTLGFCGVTAWYIVDSYNALKRIRTEDVRIVELSNQIIYLDEVLTSSARLTASSGDKRWKERYFNHVPKLDEALADTQKLSAFMDTSSITNTDEANDKLIAMEERSFELVEQGKLKEATDLLLSPEYEKQKKIYAQGLEETAVALEQYLEDDLKKQSQLTSSMMIVVAASSIILILAWIFALRKMNAYIQAINEVETVISHASLEN